MFALCAAAFAGGLAVVAYAAAAGEPLAVLGAPFVASVCALLAGAALARLRPAEAEAPDLDALGDAMAQALRAASQPPSPAAPAVEGARRAAS